MTPSTLARRLALAALLALAAGPVLAEPPSDADVNRLLAASRAQTMLDALMPQIDAMQQQQFNQLTAQHHLDAHQQDQLRRIQERTRQTLHQALSWSELRPMYVDLYKRSFSRADVLAMAEFYESPAGQSLLDKTPALMQNVMVAIQQRMQPLMADLQKDLAAITAEQPAPSLAPAANKH